MAGMAKDKEKKEDVEPDRVATQEELNEKYGWPNR